MQFLGRALRYFKWTNLYLPTQNAAILCTLFTDKFILNNAMLCPKTVSEYHAMKCINCDCSACKTSLINTDTSELTKILTWYMWESVKLGGENDGDEPIYTL